MRLRVPERVLDWVEWALDHPKAFMVALSLLVIAGSTAVVTYRFLHPVEGIVEDYEHRPGYYWERRYCVAQTYIQSGDTQIPMCTMWRTEKVWEPECWIVYVRCEDGKVRTTKVRKQPTVGEWHGKEPK